MEVARGPRRHFIIADTPGHEQYTRNMVTGASTADLSLILVDASRGITTQTAARGHCGAMVDEVTHRTVAGGMIARAI